MFVAWRELNFARGRFTLIASVVAMLMVLVGFLSGLAAGLASQNVSSVLGFKADQIVFAKPADGQKLSLSESAVTREQFNSWKSASGVDSVRPLSVQQSKMSSPDASTTVALMSSTRGKGTPAPNTDSSVAISQTAADELGVKTGDTVTISGNDFEVSAITDDAWFSHTPAVWLSRDGWLKVDRSGDFANVLLVDGSADWEAVNTSAATQSASTLGSLSAIGSFTSEAGSLGMMVALLFAISALVLSAFFTVWTMQRSADIAVLKALGSSTKALLIDSLGQALVVLTAGIGVGLALVLGFGALASQVLPFVISPFTTLLPALAMGVLGLAGVAFALKSITKANPLSALGGNR